MRCLARFDAALAVLSVWIAFPLEQSISVPGEQPRQACSPQWRVDLAVDPVQGYRVRNSLNELHIHFTAVVIAFSTGHFDQ